MGSISTLTIDYKGDSLSPKSDEQLGLLLGDEDLQKVFKLTASAYDAMIDENSGFFVQGKHFIVEAYQRLWTKKGVSKLAFFSDSDEALAFVEFLENMKEQQENMDGDKIVKIYKMVEQKFQTYAKEIEDKEHIDADELKKFVESFNMFVNLHGQITHHTSPKKQTLPPASKTKKSGFISGVVDMMKNTQSGAMDIKNSAYDFTTNTEGDAYEFGSDTRDSAYNFATKTEEDAFKFASKMEDDAYHFVSKMADDAYEFASKGMDYGYMFASQGEELGPMADRILWMASEIGIMADRIGEMGDRIVHTEHLIVNTSVLILNFGLLIDGTVKSLTDAGLNAMGMVFDKEVTPTPAHTKHLDIISKNVELILKQQHEYDMKVLENQKELRRITVSALDKIPETKHIAHGDFEVL